MPMGFKYNKICSILRNLFTGDFIFDLELDFQRKFMVNVCILIRSLSFDPTNGKNMKFYF